MESRSFLPGARRGGDGGERELGGKRTSTKGAKKFFEDDYQEGQGAGRCSRGVVAAPVLRLATRTGRGPHPLQTDRRDGVLKNASRGGHVNLGKPGLGKFKTHI